MLQLMVCLAIALDLALAWGVCQHGLDARIKKDIDTLGQPREWILAAK